MAHLGMPEALWVSRVKNFGPPIISSDTKGNGHFEPNKTGFNEKKVSVIGEIFRQVRLVK
jgi:L(+)-tartrate dehydratase beta subunit